MPGIGPITAIAVSALPPIAALEHDQWLVTHHEDRFAPEVRKVIDRIYVILRQVGAAV